MFRRDRPLLAFGIAAVVAFVQWLVGVDLMPADIVAFAAFYNVASRCGRTASLLAAGVVELGVLLVFLRYEEGGFQLATATVLVIAIAVWGASVKVRRDYLAGLVERAVRIERERDAQAQLAVAEAPSKHYSATILVWP